MFQMAYSSVVFKREGYRRRVPTRMNEDRRRFTPSKMNPLSESRRFGLCKIFRCHPCQV